MMKFVYTFLLLAFFLITPHFTHAAQTYDMSSSANWNIKVIGTQTDGRLGGTYKENFADLDNNGIKDMVLCGFGESHNGRLYSGSCYVIYDSLLSTLSGTGNTINLADSTKWNLRFDGAVASDQIGYISGATIVDLNNNAKADLLIPASGADNTRSGSGSFYVIRDDIIDNYTGTGNTVDLSNTSNFTMRYDGAASVDNKNYLSEGFLIAEDMNGNGIPDILVGSGHAGLQGIARSGSLYIIYDSLHTSYSGTGNIVDLNNDSNYSLVFYNSAMSYFTLFADILTVDMNNNGIKDIVVGGAYLDSNSRADSGSVYVIYDNLITTYTGTGNKIDLRTSSNYNIRIDGASAGDYLSWAGLSSGDIDNDGKNDLLIPAAYTDYNGLTDSGSVYIIYNTKLDDYSGTANTIDLANTASFNYRIDGASASAYFGYSIPIRMTDYNNDGKADLILPASGASSNSVSSSGSVYIIDNISISTIAGTGNVSLINSIPYIARFDGELTDDYFGDPVLLGDLNNDATLDLQIGANWGDVSGMSDAGKSYTIFNFPHTISASGSVNGSTYTITGSVTASSSVTTIAGLQYQLDSNSYSGTWTSCDSSDGSYNSRSESFTCSITASKGNHTVYLRAADSNGVYTPQSRYANKSFEIQNNSNNSSRKEPKIKKNDKGNNEGGSVQPSAGNAIDSSNKITVQLHENTFPFEGQLLANSVSGNSLKTSTNIDSVQSPQATDAPLRIAVSGRQYWQVGQIQQLWYTTYSNDTSVKPAIIIPELQAKPSVVSLSYSKADLIPAGNVRNAFNPSSLRIAHSLDGKNWNILSSSVVDEAHSSVGAVGKVGGYYMIVSPIAGAQQTLGVSKKRTLGVQNSTKQKIVKAVKQKKQIPITKQAKPKKNEIQQKNKGVVHGISTFLQSIFK